MELFFHKVIIIAFAFVTNTIQSQTFSDTSYNGKSYEEIFDFRIIGFGEASHGESLVYSERLKLIDSYLNRHPEDSLVVMIEMPAILEEKILKFNKGDLSQSELMKFALLYGLKTDTFMNFIQELTSKRVHIVGLDIQSSKCIISRLQHLLVKMNRNYCVEFLKEIDDFLIDPKDINKIQKLNNELKSTSLMKRIDTIDIQLAIKKELNHLFWLLEMSLNYQIENNYNGVRGTIFRDSCMAEIVLDAYKRFDYPILICAANYHVGDIKNSMGHFLKKKVKNEYFAILHQFYCGEILAVVTFPEWHTEVIKFKSKKNSLPNYLLKYGNNYFINCNELNSKDLKKISKDVLIQDIGAGVNIKKSKVGYRYSKVINEYDGIYFNVKSVASKTVN